MDSFYAPKGYCSVATRPVFSNDIIQTGGSFVSNPACCFGGFAVAGHTVDSRYPCQEPPLYHSAFRPTRFSQAAPVSQYCRTPLIDRIPCPHGVVGGQLAGGPLDCSTSRTPSFVAEPPAERLVLVRQKEPSDVIRTFFTKEMRELLEARFAKCKYVSKKDREELAHELCVTERQIRVWFQNRRAKERKQLGQCRSQPVGYPSSVCAGKSAARASVQMAGKLTYRLISGDARVNCIAQTPLKALYTMCQDIKPSPDNIGPVRDEEGHLAKFGEGTFMPG